MSIATQGVYEARLYCFRAQFLQRGVRARIQVTWLGAAVRRLAVEQSFVCVLLRVDLLPLPVRHTYGLPAAVVAGGLIIQPWDTGSLKSKKFLSDSDEAK
ncbi:unnamed protein product [Scytosiphon promiscuus]